MGRASSLSPRASEARRCGATGTECFPTSHELDLPKVIVPTLGQCGRLLSVGAERYPLSLPSFTWPGPGPRNGESYHEVDHTRARQGRSSGLSVAYQEVRRSGCRILFRSP